MSKVLVICCGILLTSCATQQEDTVVLLRNLRGGHAVVDGPTQTRTLTTTQEAVDLGGGAMTPRISTDAEVEAVFGGPLSAPAAPRAYLILFGASEQTLPLEADPILAELFADVAANPPAEVQITGHTDTVGSVESNDRVSRNRAVAVREALILRGLKAALIRTIGRGERSPLIPTADEVVEERNRRVEILVR